MPGLENVNAIFDTGTTMIVGDPAGITAFFAPLVASGSAEPWADSPGYFTSTWAKPPPISLCNII